jgi:hypothetical protein
MQNSDQVSSSQNPPEVFVRQGHFLGLAEQKVFVIPRACEDLPLRVVSQQPDYSKAVNMPGGVRVCLIVSLSRII